MNAYDTVRKLWRECYDVLQTLLLFIVAVLMWLALTLAAAAASNAPTNAAFWIVGGGIGFSIMLIAGIVEAYRSRSGVLMTRLGDLMEDWE